LSLDGATAESHDAFRGVKGVFDATLDAARTVREVGFRLQINTTVTRGNVHELPRMLQSILDLGADMWSVFFLVPTGRSKHLEPLTAAEEEKVLHWLHDVSTLVAIKTTEAPHYRRIAIQRAGVKALDDVFPWDRSALSCAATPWNCSPGASRRVTRVHRSMSTQDPWPLRLAAVEAGKWGCGRPGRRSHCDACQLVTQDGVGDHRQELSIVA
jgi:MoaA/NifB/PqqE/SkfB family radical SAM enzyme